MHAREPSKGIPARSVATGEGAAAAPLPLDEPAPLPPPRSAGGRGAARVNVTFTARAFPTPLRESRRKEEDDWLARNYVKLQQSQRRLNSEAAAAAAGGGGGGAAVPFTEKDAAWLKSKGDDFFRRGDFGSALNAYTAALASDAGSLPCLLNRAACHLQRRAPAPCAADCGAALALLPPLGLGDDAAAAAAATPQQRQQVLRALARRMAALAMEGKFGAALTDARRAERLDGGLAPVAERLAHLARALAAKEEADAAAAAGQADAALARYAFALELEPRYAIALLNRSALALRSERFAEGARDCEAVLRLLGPPPGEAEAAAAAAGAGGSGSAAEADEVSAVPVRGSPLFGMVEQRARARLAECRRHLGLPDVDGDEGAPAPAAAAATVGASQTSAPAASSSAAGGDGASRA